MKAVLRLSEGTIKALLRLYYDAFNGSCVDRSSASCVCEAFSSIVCSLKLLMYVALRYERLQRQLCRPVQRLLCVCVYY